MNWTADLLRAIFFALSGVAVLVGGVVALLRFVLQQPFGVSWQVEIPRECRVRRISDALFLYEIIAEARHLSLLRQRPSELLGTLLFPGEPEFRDFLRGIDEPEDVVRVFRDPERSIRVVSSGERSRWVAPGGSTTFSVALEESELAHLVRFVFVIETFQRNWFGVFGHRQPAVTFAMFRVPVSKEDLELYADTQA